MADGITEISEAPAAEAPEAVWERVLAELADRQTDELWAQLQTFERFQGGDREENLRLSALVEHLAQRDVDGDARAAGAMAARESWKTGPADGGDSGHIVPWMLKARPVTPQ